MAKARPSRSRLRVPDLRALSARYELIATFPVHVSAAYRDDHGPVGFLKARVRNPPGDE